MSTPADRLFSLLPAIYRIRDLETGGQLQALLALIDEQVGGLDDAFAALYDDQFIETCAPWVVPYIGDLIGYRPIQGSAAPTALTPRAEVANTIGFRRRKGTAAMLEELAHDVTGWPARVVEYFLLLGTTQYMNHVRRAPAATADLRQETPLLRVNGPFDLLAHTADVRRIAERRGRTNLPNAGIFLWRLQAYPVSGGTAARIASGCFTFHPLGFDAPLFNIPQTEAGITHLAEPANVPAPLERRALYAELEARRQGLADGRAESDLEAEAVYFGRRPVFTVYRAGGTPIPARKVLICDLSDPPAPLPEHWRRPPTTLRYQPADPAQPPVDLPISVAVDPVLGRIAFPIDVDPAGVTVDYAYGMPGDLGGGPYQRATTAAATVTVDPGGPDLAAVLADLGAANGIVEIRESATAPGDLTITLGPAQQLVIRAADGERPVLQGAVTIAGARDAVLTLDGLLVTGGITVTGTAAMQLEIRHTTLAPWIALAADGTPQPPADPALRWDTADSSGTLRLTRAMVGRLLCGPDLRVEITDTIVDSLGDDAAALAGSADGSVPAGVAAIATSTIIGRTHVRVLEPAENTVFTGLVTADRRQEGCVRYCALPAASQVPRRFACQPAPGDPPGSAVPQFTSRRYGDPAYAQLSARCPITIRAGADDEAALGAYHYLMEPQREQNLRVRLDEYLRFGLEAGIFYVS